jgi:hypothetical protein
MSNGNLSRSDEHTKHKGFARLHYTGNSHVGQQTGRIGGWGRLLNWVGTLWSLIFQRVRLLTGLPLTLPISSSSWATPAALRAHGFVGVLAHVVSYGELPTLPIAPYTPSASCPLA